MLRSVMRMPWATAMPIAIASANALRGASGMRRPPHDDGRRGQEQQERRREHQLPRDAHDLIRADPHEAPSDPIEDQEHEERLEQEPDRPEPGGAGAGPGAEEQQRAQE